MPVEPAAPEAIVPLTAAIWDAVHIAPYTLWTKSHVIRAKNCSDARVQNAIKAGEIKAIAVAWPSSNYPWRWLFDIESVEAWDPDNIPPRVMAIRTVEPLTPEMRDGLRMGTLLLVPQIARLKECSQAHVHRCIRSKALPAFRLATSDAIIAYRWAAYAEDVDAWDPALTPAAKPEDLHRAKEDRLPGSNCPADRNAPRPADVAKGRALYEERERQRAEYAAKVPERPRPQFGDYRPAWWSGL